MKLLKLLSLGITRICMLVLFCLVPIQALAQTNPVQVYIANQGNFSDANGSVTQFDPGAGMANQDIVSGLNTPRTKYDDS